MGDGFQVHVFGDPGMEMMPECSGCMCYNHCKNCGFREVSLFLLFHEFGVPGDGFRWLLVTLRTYLLILEGIVIEIVGAIVGAIEIGMAWGGPG